MAKKPSQTLKDQVTAGIRTGSEDTRAVDHRAIEDDIIDSMVHRDEGHAFGEWTYHRSAAYSPATGDAEGDWRSGPDAATGDFVRQRFEGGEWVEKERTNA